MSNERKSFAATVAGAVKFSKSSSDVNNLSTVRSENAASSTAISSPIRQSQSMSENNLAEFVSKNGETETPPPAAPKENFPLPKSKKKSLKKFLTKRKESGNKLNSGPQMNTQQLTQGTMQYGLSDSTTGPGIFGSTVDQLTENGTKVPRVLVECCEYVEKYGIEVKGIYRVSGGASKMNALKGMYHEDKEVDLQGLGYNPHIVAGVVKCFIRDTEILLRNRQRVNELSANKNDEMRMTELIELVDELPLSYIIILKYLLRHLNRIALNAEENMMTVENIGLVFFPTTNIPTVLLADLMNNYDSLFSKFDVQLDGNSTTIFNTNQDNDDEDETDGAKSVGSDSEL